MTSDHSALLTVGQAAARCALSRRAIYRSIERGELPAYKLCGRLRITIEDLDAWIAASAVTPASAPATDDVHVPRTVNRAFRDRIRAV